MGTRHETIVAMSASEGPLEIRRYKTRECVAACVGKLPLDIDLGRNRTASILTAETTENDNAVRLTVRVMQGRRDVTPPDLNPWIIVNPPMLVPDPAGDVEIARLDADGNEQRRRYREDPLAVLIGLMDRKLR